jgi:hypothetical protein
MRADFIELVATPRLHDVDKPIQDDQSRFEIDLKAALEHQILAADNQPTIDLSGIADRLSAFSWSGIFKKVQAVYNAVGTTR